MNLLDYASYTDGTDDLGYLIESVSKFRELEDTLDTGIADIRGLVEYRDEIILNLRRFISKDNIDKYKYTFSIEEFIHIVCKAIYDCNFRISYIMKKSKLDTVANFNSYLGKSRHTLYERAMKASNSSITSESQDSLIAEIEKSLKLYLDNLTNSLYVNTDTSDTIRDQVIAELNNLIRIEVKLKLSKYLSI